MKIAVSGRGNIGRTPTQRWFAAVMRWPSDSGSLPIRSRASSPAARCVMLAVPGAAAKPLVAGPQRPVLCRIFAISR